MDIHERVVRANIYLSYVYGSFVLFKLYAIYERVIVGNFIGKEA